MDRNTILAIVLTVIIITVSMVIQTNNQMAATDAAASSTAVNSTTSQADSSQKIWGDRVVSTDAAEDKQFIYSTDFFDVTFDTKGASINALELKAYKDGDKNVDVVFNPEGMNNAFLLYLGNEIGNPVDSSFSYQISGNKVVFTGHFLDTSTSTEFTIRKIFEFRPSDYLINVSVEMDPEINFNGYTYTLAYEPQVGPEFEKMDSKSNYEYRRFYLMAPNDNGKLKKTMPNVSSKYTYSNDIEWVSMTGKYFSVVAVPQADYDLTLTQSSSESLSQVNGMYFSRVASDDKGVDTIYFYCGPQLKQYLGDYYAASSNEWGIKGLNLEDAMDSSSWLIWLENILKWCLEMLFKIIPNYGVDIIILTLVIKVILYPLQKKSMASTAKMSAMGPQMEELKEKYKDNPEKLNQATAALYKEAGVSPLGGCLPMLVQFPIFIALYGLLNKHFELRGAMFIPGWIPDLSIPDTVLTLGFDIPFLGNALHLLPIIYTVSMIYSMKITQAPGSAPQQGSMKFMTYGMPIVFFFVLYNSPSGLLVYWTVQNFLSIIQQIFTNNKKKADDNDPVKQAQRKKEQDAKKVPKAVLEYQEKLRKQSEQNKGAKK